jgi:MFS family permease
VPPEELFPPDPVPTGDRPARLGMLSRLAVDTRPLRHRDFRNLWIGQAVSTIGGMIGTVAVPYQVYSLTHSTLAVGLLGLAALVPLLVVPLVGGAIADAGDRRAVLLRTEVGMVAVTALFLGNSLLPHPQVWALYVLEAVAVSVYSLGRPAMASLTPRLVPEDQIAAASSVQSIYESFAAVAGPAAGGILIAAIGISGAFAIDLATYAASLIALARLPRIPPSEEAERPSLRSIVDGFRYVLRSQPLIGIFAVDTSAMVFGMPSALFPAYAEHFGGGASTLGYLYAAPYAGALVGSLLSGWTTHVHRYGIAITVCACGWGVAIVGFGLVSPLWAALVALAVAGGADFFSAVLRGTMLMRVTPDHLRGRLSGIEFTQVAGAPNLGNLEAGIVASIFSLRTAVVSGGVLCVAGCIAVALALPRFLRYDARAGTA